MGLVDRVCDVSVVSRRGWLLACLLCGQGGGRRAVRHGKGWMDGCIASVVMRALIEKAFYGGMWVA